jgi:PiT family inorganic phosphate transporter
VLLTASHLGFPLSTTHSITGAVLGAGAAKRLSAVRWGLAGNIAVAWALTIPAAASVGAVTYGVSQIFGEGALGPLLIAVSLLMLMAAMFGKRLRGGPAITAVADA